MARAEDKRKSIALVLTGFAITPREVESLVGVTATSSGIRGERMKPNRENMWKRSHVAFEFFMPSDVLLADMLPTLLQSLGGVDHLCRVKDQVKPEYLHINIVLPIKGSQEQEGGYFDLSDLADLGKLGATLGFEFL